MKNTLFVDIFVVALKINLSFIFSFQASHKALLHVSMRLLSLQHYRSTDMGDTAQRFCCHDVSPYCHCHLNQLFLLDEVVYLFPFCYHFPMLIKKESLFNWLSSSSSQVLPYWVDYTLTSRCKRRISGSCQGFQVLREGIQSKCVLRIICHFMANSPTHILSLLCYQSIEVRSIV